MIRMNLNLRELVRTQKEISQKILQIIYQLDTLKCISLIIQLNYNKICNIVLIPVIILNTNIRKITQIIFHIEKQLMITIILLLIKIGLMSLSMNLIAIYIMNTLIKVMKKNKNRKMRMKKSKKYKKIMKQMHKIISLITIYQ